MYYVYIIIKVYVFLDKYIFDIRSVGRVRKLQTLFQMVIVRSYNK